MSYIAALQERLDALRVTHQRATQSGDVQQARELAKAITSLAERVMDLRTVVND